MRRSRTTRPRSGSRRGCRRCHLGRDAGRTVYSGIQDLYGYYYNVGPDGLRFYYDVILANITGTKAAWHVLDPYAQPPGYVTMNAPHSFFCP